MNEDAAVKPLGREMILVYSFRGGVWDCCVVCFMSNYELHWPLIEDCSELMAATSKFIRISKADDLNIWRLDSDGGLTTVYSTADRHFDMNSGEGLAGKVQKTGRPLYEPDLQRSSVAQHLDLVGELGWHSAYIVPILAGHRLLGVLALYSRTQSHDFDPNAIADSMTEYAISLLAESNVEIEKGRASLASRLDKLEAMKSDLFTARFAVGGELHDCINTLGSVLDTLSKVVADPTIEQQLAIARRDTKRALTHLQSVREHGNSLRSEELNSNRFRVHRLVNRVKQIHEPVAQSNDVDIEIDVDPDVQHWWGDEHKIGQALHNLVGNSLYFLQQSPKRRKKKVRITAYERNTTLYFSVEDNGPGCSDYLLPQVFDEFVTSKPTDEGIKEVEKLLSAEQEKTGYGLGLAMVKYYSQLHGGNAIATSSWGQNFKVSFWIQKMREESKR